MTNEKFKFKIFVICLVVLVSCSKNSNTSTTQTEGGNSSSGGGSGAVSEFLLMANKNLSLIASHGDIRNGDRTVPNSYRRLRQTVSKLKVTATNKTLFFEGTEVTAKNYPSKVLVDLNIDGWNPLESKQLLVCHEMIELTFTRAELSDDHFEICRQILARNSLVFQSLPQDSRFRESRSRLLRFKAEDAAIHGAVNNQHLQNVHVDSARTAILRNAVDPLSVDTDRSVQAEVNLNDLNNNSEPDSLVRVFIVSDTSDADWACDVHVLPDGEISKITFQSY